MAESLKEKTARGLFWGGMSNTVQQAVGVVFGIALAHRLTPDEYGMVSMIMVFQLIANALQESGFKLGLVNLTDPQHEDYNSVFWFNVGVASILYVVLFFSSPLIAAFYGNDALTPLCRYAFLSFVINSFGMAQCAWLTKHLRIKQQAKAAMVAVLTSSVVAVVMAYSGCSYWSIATQNIVYVAVTTALLWHYSKWRPTLRGITMKPVMQMFPFSCKILATYIASHINSNVLNVLLGKYFGEYNSGVYYQAYQWNFKGLSVVQNMVLSVAQPVLVDVRDDVGHQLAVLRKMIRLTAFLSFPLLLGFGLVAHEFIVLAITERWIESARFLQIMSISGAIVPISTLLANLIISRGRSGTYFVGTLMLGVTLIATMMCIHSLGITAMVVAYTVITSAWVLVWFCLATPLCHYRFWHFLTDVLPFALAALAVMTVTHFATRPIGNLWLLLVTRIVVAALLYFTVMKVAHVKILDECLQFIKRKH